MAVHAAEEKRLAVEKGNFLQGNPFITVIGDGGWGKRSYGHGFNSSSGVVSWFDYVKNCVPILYFHIQIPGPHTLLLIVLKPILLIANL